LEILRVTQVGSSTCGPGRHFNV